MSYALSNKFEEEALVLLCKSNRKELIISSRARKGLMKDVIYAEENARKVDVRIAYRQFPIQQNTLTYGECKKEHKQFEVYYIAYITTGDSRTAMSMLWPSNTQYFDICTDELFCRWDIKFTTTQDRLLTKRELNIGKILNTDSGLDSLL